MFQFDWAARARWRQEAPVGPTAPSPCTAGGVAAAMLLHWQEHCVECAVPHCYDLCSLYVPRADRKCARLHYGMVPVPQAGGLYGDGADLRFRRWGKIEAVMTRRALSPVGLRRLAAADRLLTGAVTRLSDLIARLSPKRRLSGALTWVRGLLLRRWIGRERDDYDAFVLDCINTGSDDVTLMLELREDALPVFRHAFPLRPGANLHTLPASTLAERRAGSHRTLALFPEGEGEPRLIFRWLDLVAFRDGRPPAGWPPDNSRFRPADTVKCVAWDLDNTLWTGVLSEDGADALALREDAAALVRLLDRRGILQTVVSKNDHAAALACLERFGLDEYFLFPAINWGQKSVNLRQIAQRLNIGLDTLALIDDSPFERAEVARALPMVRTYSDAQIAGLPDHPPFDVPVSVESGARRQSYRTEVRREHARAGFDGSYEDFLRSCGMTARLFVPRRDADVQRCHELIQRSNQLNLSGRRYSADAFRDLLAHPGALSVAVACGDRFGHYGIVGFLHAEPAGGVLSLREMALSCRVARKRVEHALCVWLGGRAAGCGFRTLTAQLVRTPANGPLVQVFGDLGFAETPDAAVAQVLDALPPDDGILQIVDEVEWAPESSSTRTISDTATP